METSFFPLQIYWDFFSNAEGQLTPLISCAVIAQLICAFVFANAKGISSLDAAYVIK